MKNANYFNKKKRFIENRINDEGIEESNQILIDFF